MVNRALAKREKKNRANSRASIDECHARLGQGEKAHCDGGSSKLNGNLKWNENESIPQPSEYCQSGQ